MEKELTELLDDKIQGFRKLEDKLDHWVTTEQREEIMNLVCELVNTQKHIDNVVNKANNEQIEVL